MEIYVNKWRTSVQWRKLVTFGGLILPNTSRNRAGPLRKTLLTNCGTFLGEFVFNLCMNIASSKENTHNTSESRKNSTGNTKSICGKRPFSLYYQLPPMYKCRRKEESLCNFRKEDLKSRDKSQKCPRQARESGQFWYQNCFMYGNFSLPAKCKHPSYNSGHKRFLHSI